MNSNSLSLSSSTTTSAEAAVTIEVWKDRVTKVLNEASCVVAKKPASNREKRIVYSNIELLRLDLEDELLLMSPSDDTAALASTSTPIATPPAAAVEIQTLIQQLNEALPSLSFHSVQRSPHFYDFIDKFTRLSAAVIVLVYMGWFSVFCVLITPLDDLLVYLKVIKTHQKFNVHMRRLAGSLVVGTSGIELETRGLQNLDNTITNVVCFSHSSTLDAFTGSAALPAPSLAVSKKELFLIPFFSWMMTAWGSIPVNRNNRSSAVQSLETAQSAAGIGDCVMIAPEGTRSTTGQLAVFKKGPFYLWEAMGKVPIVPLVIYGAYELYPPGSVFNSCGKVYCEFLPPLSAAQTVDREVASRSLRRIMLNHMMTSAPEDAGENISWRQRIYTLFLVIGAHALNLWVLRSIYLEHVALKPGAGAGAENLLWGYPWVQLTLNWLIVTAKVSLLAMIITGVMFIYTTIIKVAIMKMWKNGKKNNKNEVKGGKDKGEKME